MKKWCMAFLLMGFIACKQKDPQQIEQQSKVFPPAIVTLYEQVASYPDSTALRILLVNALDSVNALPEALAQMDSLLKRDSANFGIWFNKAQLEEKAGDTSKALSAYQQAIHIYPSPDALLSSANLLAEQRNAQALLLCDEVERLRLGRNYLAHCSFIKGVYYARTGDLVKALASFDRCIGNDYQYIAAYMEKGFIYFEHEQPLKAKTVFQQASIIRPTDADAAYWWAKTFEKTGNRDSAIIQYQRALLLDPSIKEAKTAIARLQTP